MVVSSLIGVYLLMEQIRTSTIARATLRVTSSVDIAPWAACDQDAVKRREFPAKKDCSLSGGDVSRRSVRLRWKGAGIFVSGPYSVVRICFHTLALHTGVRPKLPGTSQR